MDLVFIKNRFIRKVKSYLKKCSSSRFERYYYLRKYRLLRDLNFKLLNYYYYEKEKKRLFSSSPSLLNYLYYEEEKK